MSRNYAEMTRDELIEAIENEHGTATADDAPDAVLRTQLQALDSEKAQEAKPKKGAKTTKAEASAEPAKTVRIKIFGDKNLAGDVIVTVDEKNYQLKRQVEIDVPMHVYHALNDAVITEFSWDEKTGANVPNDRHRYPFQVIPR